jgi:hypothetical protein
VTRSSALLALALLVSSAAAQTVPFAITGAGTAPEGLPLPGQDARPHNIVGVAPFLGLHTGEGMVLPYTIDVFDPTAGIIAGEFKGSFNFRKRNGSTLATTYGDTDAGASTPGTYTITITGMTPEGEPIATAFFVAEFVVDPAASTGQFAGVTGKWTMYAQTGPFVLGSSDPLSYGWVGAGSLTFPRPFRGTATGQVTGIGGSGELIITYTGQATHLGNFTREERLFLNPDGTFTGTMVFTAANGDELWVEFAGAFVSPTTAEGSYTFVGGTGRFRDATGSADFQAVTPDGVHVTAEFEGSISY